MLKKLQKYAPAILLLLLVTLIAALFFSPPSARLLSIIIIVFGIGTAILFTVHGNWEKHKEGEITRAEFVRNTIIDLLGLALIMGSAVWFGRLAGTYIGLAWGNVLGIVVAVAVGFIAAFIVGKIW
ncbi:hypothetical protein DRJ25_06060, partial [Candidatus Woesearchaeota archaeon]